MNRRYWPVALGLAALLALAGPWGAARAEDGTRADVDDVMMSVVKDPDADEQRFVGDIELPAAAEQGRARQRNGSEASSHAQGDGMETGPARAADVRRQGQDARRNNATAGGKPESGAGRGQGRAPRN